MHGQQNIKTFEIVLRKNWLFPTRVFSFYYRHLRHWSTLVLVYYERDGDRRYYNFTECALEQAAWLPEDSFRLSQEVEAAYPIEA